MTERERDEWAKSLPDGRVSKKGTLLCPSCNSHRLDRCLGGVGHYECAECGQLLWDPNLKKS